MFFKFFFVIVEFREVCVEWMNELKELIYLGVYFFLFIEKEGEFLN